MELKKLDDAKREREQRERELREKEIKDRENREARRIMEEKEAALEQMRQRKLKE